MRVLDTSSISPTELARELQRLDREARKRLDDGFITVEGHYAAAVGNLHGFRISVRYNRHRQREVSLSATDKHSPISAKMIDIVSEAHRAATGARLRIRYTEPRNYRHGREDHLMWAVMQTDLDDSQRRLM